MRGPARRTLGTAWSHVEFVARIDPLWVEAVRRMDTAVMKGGLDFAAPGDVDTAAIRSYVAEAVSKFDQFLAGQA